MQLQAEKNKALVEARLSESARVLQAVARHCSREVVAAASCIAQAFASHKKLLICGNGGSAADSQHLAAEFVSCLTQDFARPGLPALALTTDTSLLSAFANDFGFEGVFARQVETLGKPGDVLLGISTSGNSGNVVLAVEAAHLIGMQVVVLTGQGGKLAALADVAIQVPSRETAVIQEAHLALEHLICHLSERMLFEEEEAA